MWQGGCMKRFTDDETGEKYEGFEINGNLAESNSSYVIKPVVKKEGYRLGFSKQGGFLNLLPSGVYEFTEPQANAVSEAIKSLMEYINDPLNGMNHRPELDEAIYEAHKALKGNAL